MKSLKLIALSAFITLSVFCIVVYSSCSKDGCKGVTCLNRGTCGGGPCTCITGIGGTNCELVYRNLYSNTYLGNATDSAGAVVYLNSRLVFSPGKDTMNYNNMDLEWYDPGTGIPIDFTIVLSNNLSTGSNFTVNTLTTTPDSFTYTGGGSVNGNVASLTLYKTHPNILTKIIVFTNFNKQ